ncbi:MAG: hypothetical protein FWG90_10605 [Oscillospiraceae bacterium]|nr:hypothetical protein [Oscillospiraceae bacterium]
MASSLETREKQKQHLGELLDIKKQNKDAGIEVVGLQKAIIRAINVMDQEDVAWVEKNYGIKAV